MNVLSRRTGGSPVEYAVFRVKASQRSESVCLCEMDQEVDFNGYRIQRMFPALGTGESYRLAGRYVLTENDLCNGFADLGGRPYHRICRSSGGHPRPWEQADSYGKYGIPYECMLPKEIENLMVAYPGRILFSHRSFKRTALPHDDRLGRGGRAGPPNVHIAISHRQRLIWTRYAIGCKLRGRQGGNLQFTAPLCFVG